MRKKTLHIVLLYLASGIVLAHNFVPHHHHDGEQAREIAHHDDYKKDHDQLHQLFHSLELYPHSESEGDTFLHHAPLSVFAKYFSGDFEVPTSTGFHFPTWRFSPPPLLAEVVALLRPQPLAFCVGLRGPPAFRS